MKDLTEKDLRGGMKATGLSAAALFCVCLAQILGPAHHDKSGIPSEVVLYLAIGSLICSIILFVYYLTKYRKLKNN